MNTRPKANLLRRWTFWSLLAVPAVGVAAYSAMPYLLGDPELSKVRLDPDVESHYLSLAVHAVPGILALFIGPFQFLTWLRIRYPKTHRIAGRVYMMCVVAGAVFGLFAATFSTIGFSGQVAFYLITAAWLYTLFQAYRTIRRGEVQLHRIWMIRNYALTFAAVTLRIYLGIGLALQEAYFPSLTFEEVYITSAWMAFLINALVAEYFIVQRTLAPLARRGKRRDAATSVPPPGRGAAEKAVRPPGGTSEPQTDAAGARAPKIGVRASDGRPPVGPNPPRVR